MSVAFGSSLGSSPLAQKSKYSNSTNVVSRRTGLGQAACRVVFPFTKFFRLIGSSVSFRLFLSPITLSYFLVLLPLSKTLRGHIVPHFLRFPLTPHSLFTALRSLFVKIYKSLCVRILEYLKLQNQQTTKTDRHTKQIHKQITSLRIPSSFGSSFYHTPNREMSIVIGMFSLHVGTSAP